MAIRPSSEGGLTVGSITRSSAPAPPGSGSETERPGASRDRSLSALTIQGSPIRDSPLPSLLMATRPLSEDMGTTAETAQRGSGQGAAASGLNKDPSCLVRAALMVPPNK